MYLNIGKSERNKSNEVSLIQKLMLIQFGMKHS